MMRGSVPAAVGLGGQHFARTSALAQEQTSRHFLIITFIPLKHDKAAVKMSSLNLCLLRLKRYLTRCHISELAPQASARSDSQIVVRGELYSSATSHDLRWAELLRQATADLCIGRFHKADCDLRHRTISGTGDSIERIPCSMKQAWLSTTAIVECKQELKKCNDSV